MSLFDKLPYTKRLLESIGAPVPGQHQQQQGQMYEQEDPNAEGEEPIDEGEQDADVETDHPANHPAVHAAHQGFITTHDAMADDPTPENVALHDQYWQQLKAALEQYVFHHQGDGSEEEGLAEELEEELEDEDGTEEPEGQEEGEEEEVDDGPEQPSEATPAKKKPNPFQKKESSAYIRTNAQLHGVGCMNSHGAQHLHVTYNSEEETPWQISNGSRPLSGGYSTQEEAEHALAGWVSQSQQHMEMMGKERVHDRGLLKVPVEATTVTARGVMGGQKQDFAPPRVGGGNFKEATFIEPGSMDLDAFGEVGGNLKESSAAFAENTTYGSTPSLLQLALNGMNNEVSRSDEGYYPKPINNLQESASDPVAPEVFEIRESSCPACAGLGCGACDGEGKVSRKVEAAMQLAIDDYSKAQGSNLMWSSQEVKPEFFGSFKPVETDDPMVAAYEQINLARSRH